MTLSIHMGHPRSNFQNLFLVLLVNTLMQNSLAVVNRGANLRNNFENEVDRNVSNTGNNVVSLGNNVANSRTSVANSGNSVASSENPVASSGNSVGNLDNSVANSGSNVASLGNSVANSGNSVANSGNNVANSTLDEIQTYIGATTEMTADKDNIDSKNQGTTNRGGRVLEESKEEGRGRKIGEEGGGGGRRREGRLEGRKYLKNNMTEVDYLLDRSESVQREGIYPYHHSPNHVEYEADEHHHHPHHHALNFPHHDHHEYHQHHDYPQVHHQHHHSHHNHHHELPYDVAVKASLGPLVGVALLGVVASLIANPVLLQLGVVGAGKRRRRRHAPHSAHTALDLSVITSLLSQVPKSTYLLSQERGMIDNYMKCSGLLSSIQDGCVLRLACELWSENSKLFQSQRSVVRRTLSEIMASELLPYHIREMIFKASEHGKRLGQCQQYHCKKFEGSPEENLEKFERN